MASLADCDALQKYELSKLNRNATFRFASDPHSASPSMTIQCYDGRIDWSVAKRLLLKLYWEGPTKITRLGMSIGLNHGSCRNYVAWMKEISWLVDDRGQLILTGQGRKLAEYYSSSVIIEV